MSDATRQDLVREQTEIRRALLRNGYSPFPCEGKSGQIHGWPDVQATDDLIAEWSNQLRWVSTAVHTGVRGLVGLDIDIDDAETLEGFIDRIPDDLWARLKTAPVRRGGGVKEMWLVRLADGEKARRYKDSTGKWGNPASGEDDSDHKIEVWAKERKLLALYGARTVEAREITSRYSWVDEIGPHCVPVEDLPEITNADIDTLLRYGVEAMQARGWERLDVSEPGEAAERLFDLTDDMMFQTRDHGDVDLAGLIDLCGAVGDVRMYSWLPGKRRRADRCHAKLNDYDGLLQIHDYDTGVTHRAVEAEGAYSRSVSEDVRHLAEILGERLSRTDTGRTGDEARDTESGAGLNRLERLMAAVPIEARMFRQSAADSGGAGEDGVPAEAAGKPVLDITPGRLAVATVEAAAALCASETVFDMGGRLVTLGESGVIVEMTEARTALELGAMFRCVRIEKRGEKERVVEADPPQGLVRQVLSCVKETGYRALRGVVDVPVLRADGSLVGDGYDVGSRLVISDDMDVAALIQDSENDARAALAVLWEPFAEFPFAGDGDRGGALACALTAVCRAWLPTAPAFAFDAPVQGSGKSLLCRALGALSGNSLLHAPLPLRDEDEVRKTLLSILLDAPRSVIFDNQLGMVDSASLGGMLTAEVFSGRLLGSNTTIKAPTGLLVMLNGNNLSIGGDMPRRTVRVRIDPKMETPFERQFDFDPETWVRENRRELVAAALVLLRWGVASAVKGRVGSFERWDEVVGQTVARVGKELDDRFGDPAGVIRAAHADDPRRDELGDLLTALRDEFGNKWFTGSDVASRMAGAGSSNPLVEAFGYDKAPNSKAVGRHLSFRRDAKVDGFCIQASKDPHKKVNRFRIWSDEDEADVIVDGALEQRRAAVSGRLAHLTKN